MKQLKIYNIQLATCPQGIYNLSPRDLPPRGRRYAAFTLVELMIVVAILGIMAAIVLPEFQSQSQQAKEAAAKANLKIYREAIERYALDHNGVAPGYPLNNTTLIPSAGALKIGFINTKKYLPSLIYNPFNNISLPLMINDSTDFPTEPTQTDVYGWIYKPATKTIKLNWAGTDSEGKEYFSY